jgi:ABC-type nitrate/sulfonate/bicarbonate transport system ATPase subunit/ABC-type nitrate/sulfonate/bicarbonate transport system permease component
MGAAPGAPHRSPPGRWALAAAGVLLLLAAWGLATLAGGRFFVPPPWTAIADTALLLTRAGTWSTILITFLRVCVGFAAGYAAGAAAGVAMGARREIDALLKPAILFFQGIPPMLWAIPIIVVMGIGHAPTILVIALITLPVVAVTVGEGMSTLPRVYREMLNVFAPGLRARVKELVFPHLRPFLTAALNVGLVLAVKSSVVAEYFGANDGIGFQIQSAYQVLNIRGLFSWGLILILMILLFNAAMPRVRLIGPLLGRGAGLSAAFQGPRACRPEDIAELKGIFTARKSSPRIELHDVSFSYRRGQKVLEGVSLSVRSNEIAVITGDSGVGKTTLVKLTASLLRPAAGRVSCPPGIGFVFQDDRLLPWRSVVDNTALPLLYQGHSVKSARCFASYLLSEAGLAGEEEKRPEELSGGMKKRAALARCFARIPEAIILDEPFSGLHGEARRTLWNKFLHLLALHPVPVMVVTHFPEEVSGAPGARVYRLSGSPASLALERPARRR